MPLAIPSKLVRLLSARFLFTWAVQMQAVMLGFRMYSLTHSALHLGMIGLSEAVPALGLALYAGYVVDHNNPLRIYRLVISVSLLSALIFWGSQALSMSATVQVTLLYVAGFATGLARAFSQPAIFATVPKLVPRALLPKASAWMATSMQVARIGGPAVGGMLVGWMGAPWAAASVCGLLLLGSAVLIGTTVAPTPSVATAQTRRLGEMLVGARFVLTHPILWPALSLDMLSVLFGGVTALLPVFAAEILTVDVNALGYLRAAPAVGATIGSLALAHTGVGRHAGVLLLTAVVGFGSCILIFGLSRSLPLCLLALGLSGAFDSISVVIRSAAVQLNSPDSMRGRISAVNAIFIGSSNELGEFESGLVAHLMGTVPAVLLGGAVCLLVVAVVAVRYPALRQLDLTAEYSP